jgi:bifunctional non-homologous end joining protein LigD
MLWDTGTWKPLVDDVDAALAKGDLKFELDGYKLKGSWVLVRTRGYGGNRGDGRSWLLIKHRDEWSGDVDITEFAPRSVKSDPDFPEILADDNPDIWKSNRPVSGGETGALLREIIQKAAELKSSRSARSSKSARSSRSAGSSKGSRSSESSGSSGGSESGKKSRSSESGTPKKPKR